MTATEKEVNDRMYRSLADGGNWVRMLPEIINHCDDGGLADIWAYGWLTRIAKHLDSLPAEHRLPMPPLDELIAAYRGELLMSDSGCDTEEELQSA